MHPKEHGKLREASDFQLTPLSLEALGLVRLTYSFSETMQLLGLSRSGLYQLINDGSLPSVKYGKKHSFCGADIAALVNRRRQIAAKRAA